MTKKKRATLAEEMKHFSERAWEYKSHSETGQIVKAAKAVRERNSQEIKFYTTRGMYARSSWGETINDIGMNEVMTYAQFKKMKTGIVCQ